MGFISLTCQLSRHAARPMVYTPAGRLTTDSFNTNSRQNGSFNQRNSVIELINSREKLYPQ